MKLYRYMSLNEFFQLAAGNEIVSFNGYERAPTNLILKI